MARFDTIFYEIPHHQIAVGRYRRSLHNKWEQIAQPLMSRNGSNPDILGGGHRIQQNPVLVEAIQEIRDEYYRLFHHKHVLHKKVTAKEISLKEYNRGMQDVDHDLIIHNNQSFMRLQQRNYGFSQEQVDHILAHVPETAVVDMPAPLSVADAAKITGKVIKCAIDSFELAMQRDKTVRCSVPHIALSKSPERAGHVRSRPAIDPRRFKQLEVA